LTKFPLLGKRGHGNITTPSGDLLTSEVIKLREIYFSDAHIARLQFLTSDVLVYRDRDRAVNEFSAWCRHSVPIKLMLFRQGGARNFAADDGVILPTVHTEAD
jgi:hypothetical protein